MSANLQAADRHLHSLSLQLTGAASFGAALSVVMLEPVQRSLGLHMSAGSVLTALAVLLGAAILTSAAMLRLRVRATERAFAELDEAELAIARARSIASAIASRRNLGQPAH